MTTRQALRERFYVESAVRSPLADRADKGNWVWRVRDGHGKRGGVPVHFVVYADASEANCRSLCAALNQNSL